MPFKVSSVVIHFNDFVAMRIVLVCFVTFVVTICASVCTCDMVSGQGSSCVDCRYT